jgi:carboxymethylenebutenolidase
MLERQTLATPEGHEFQVRIAYPSDGKPAPALIMLHEWFGVTGETERMARQFADAGFVVAAVDMYGGRVAANESEAASLMQAMDSLESAKLVRAAAIALADRPEVAGGVGVLGFCMGGAVTFVCACHVPEAKAFAPFYGIPVASKVDWTRTHGPIEAHFAKVDAWATPEKAQAAVDAVNAAGGHARVHLYDGGHAFMRASDPKVFHEDSAKLAFERCVAFFHEHLDAR